MPLYNDTFMDNVTNPVDIITGLSSAIGQEFLIGNLILLGFFLIFMILAIRQDFLRVLVIDSFLTTLLAILFFIAGIVSATIIIIPAILFFIGLLFYFIS